MLDEVLTIKEVDALLELAENAFYTMAQAGEIPALESEINVAVQQVMGGAIEAARSLRPCSRPGCSR